MSSLFTSFYPHQGIVVTGLPEDPIKNVALVTSSRGMDVRAIFTRDRAFA